ncbi:type II secretion system protein N [Marinobacter sp. SS21]|uniref:type II secretion system protein N n=1 Tax=Marinobacter sp. SS21 TaxID=2979460 RepID=UPI00232B5583|nr:type II secretion system protein N [Marinobacter sp. SS21]MDC0663377.1 type II secretion system protein N [Marinobacter sp. SS21]
MSALNARLPLLLALVTVLAMAAALGWQGYSLWLQTQADRQQAAQSAITPATSGQTQTPSISLAEVELFGTASAEVTAQVTNTENLPETNLRLYLRGVLAAEGEFPGSALIEDDSNITDSYLVGDELPGNATLRSVHTNRVIIERSGKLENLYFPELDDSSGMDFAEEDGATTADTDTPAQPSGASTSGSPVVSTPEASEQRREEIRQRLEQLRERLRSNSN